MLYRVMRPSSLNESNPVFTRYGGLTQSYSAARNRAIKCGGRLYSTDGHNFALLADFYTEPAPTPAQGKREYWAARNQAAVFA